MAGARGSESDTFVPTNAVYCHIMYISMPQVQDSQLADHQLSLRSVSGFGRIFVEDFRGNRERVDYVYVLCEQTKVYKRA